MLSTPLDIKHVNSDELPDMTGRQENEKLLTELTNGDCILEVAEIIKQIDDQNSLLLDYLSFIYQFVDLNWQVMAQGFTDAGKTNAILGVIKSMMACISDFYDQDKKTTWYCTLLMYSKSTVFSNTVAVQLLRSNIMARCLDILALFAKMRGKLQIVAYLRYFRESYDGLKKFRCRLSFLSQIFEMFDMNDRIQSSPVEQETKGLNIGKIFLKHAKSKVDKVNQVVPEFKESSRAAVSLHDQIAKLRTFKQPFMSLLAHIYQSAAIWNTECEATALSDFTAVNNQIQKTAFEVMNAYFCQAERFQAHLDNILLFVGHDEVCVLHDFEGDTKTFGNQVVSIVRLREKIEQILSDDLTSQNQLQNISSNDNKQRRILELTNIINKILAKFTDRLPSPNLFRKMQDLMRILNFHKILTGVLRIKFDKKRHFTMLSKTVKLFEYFCLRNDANTTSLVAYCRYILQLIEHGVPSGRLLSIVYSSMRSVEAKRKAIKDVVEKIYRVADSQDRGEDPHLFMPACRSRYAPDRTREDQTFNTESDRAMLIEYFKVVRRLILNNNKLDPVIQQEFVESLIFCFALSKNLLPNYLETLMGQDVKEELSTTNTSLLQLLIEFYATVNLAIENNCRACLVVTSLIDQTSIKAVIMSDEFHPRLKVRLVSDPHLDQDVRRGVHLLPLQTDRRLFGQGETRGQDRRSSGIRPRPDPVQVSLQLTFPRRLWRL